MEEKNCRLAWCNKPLVRKEGESLSHFKKRKFCDHTCANQHTKNYKKGSNAFVQAGGFQKEVEYFGKRN